MYLHFLLLANKNVNSKRDIRRRGVVDILPQLDKAFIFKVKRKDE